MFFFFKLYSFSRPSISTSPNTQPLDQKQKVPPITLRKLNGNGRLVTITSPQISPQNAKNQTADSVRSIVTAQLGHITVRQNLMSNTIDLTDEEDPKPKTNSSNQPPALVALTNRMKKTQLQLKQKSPPVTIGK